MKHNKLNEALALVLFLILCLSAELMGSLLTMSSVDTWYQTIEKPSWTPPNWLFAPVWTTLFLLMAVSAWMIWLDGGIRQNIVPLALFIIQLAFNVLWSGLFFANQSPGLAFINIVFLWFLILSMIIAFIKVKQIAGYMNIPYMLWVTYAGALNLSIWRLNS